MKKLFTIIVLLSCNQCIISQELRELATRPDAIVDLKTTNGTALVSAKWFLMPAKIESKDFHLPGPSVGGRDALQLYPTGALTQTNFLVPQVDSKEFEKK